MAPTPEPLRELASLEVMVDELDRFLDEGRPYRPVVVDLPEGGKVPATMSLGIVLELVGALRVSQTLTGAQQARYRDAERRFVALRAARPAEFAGALQRELKSQLDTWNWYLDDCARGERDRVADYHFEAGVRSRIAALTQEAQSCGVDVEGSIRTTATLDASLRNVLREGPYGGPAGQADRFPKQVYWWLYGQPVADRESITGAQR